MHIFTIVAFGLLFWRTESTLDVNWLDESDYWQTVAVVALQPLALAFLAWLITRRTRAMLRGPVERASRAQHFYHRALFGLRLLLMTGFATTVLATPWPDWFELAPMHPAFQIVGDLGVLSLYFAGAVAIWIAVFPMERELRADIPVWGGENQQPARKKWGLGTYLDFNIRHHLLVVAVPLTLILFGANLTRGYREKLQDWFGWVWAPEMALALIAVIVFVTAPLMLRYVWRTRSVEAGPLRARLEQVCRRIGFRCRDLLVWRTDGLTINAAVMGVVGPLRYVLLSDALLATMTPQQIEAVFGHEAGHVRHRHMQHFLAFSFVGWLFVAGLMEGLAHLSRSGVFTGGLSLSTIEVIGIVATVLFWGIGFGWVSRRFERQADLFGARCVTPDEKSCAGPCSVHSVDSAPPLPRGDSGGSLSEVSTVAIRPPVPNDGRVCSTGAAVFASALDRVATLNGIPREEHSWRHSSIGNRIRSLASLAGDPVQAWKFERGLRRLQAGLWIVAILGAVACVGYWIVVPEPAILQLQASVQ